MGITGHMGFRGCEAFIGFRGNRVCMHQRGSCCKGMKVRVCTDLEPVPWKGVQTILAMRQEGRPYSLRAAFMWVVVKIVVPFLDPYYNTAPNI